MSQTDASQTSDKDIAIEALNYLLQGKRHLLVEDYSSAVTSLQEACRLFDIRYGIGAPECGDAYLYYGSALLELARLEEGVIDGVVHTKVAELSETETEGEDDNEEDDDDEQNDDSQGEDKSNDNKSEGKKTDNEEDLDDSEGNEGAEEGQQKKECVAGEEEQQSNKASDEQNNDLCVPSTSTSTPNQTNEEEDANDDENEASSIEIAWEVLTLAKNVFKQASEEKHIKLKLAEALQKLGEISIEWENNQNAIEILTECLNLRKEILPEDDRLIAETYYHLGIAFSFSNQCENANICFHSAIGVIENRVDNQRKAITSTPTDKTDVIASIEREISQLENLLPEMRVKIEDSRDQMDNAMEALRNEEQERIKEESVAVKTHETKDKPVSDVSHLIKRKRQTSGSSEPSPKKVLCSNGHNVLNNEKTSDAPLSHSHS